MSPNGRKVRGRNYKSIGFVLDLRFGPNARSKLMKPRGSKFQNPFFSAYESIRVNDVPLKVRKTICVYSERELCITSLVPSLAPGEIQSSEWQGELCFSQVESTICGKQLNAFIHA